MSTILGRLARIIKATYYHGKIGLEGELEGWEEELKKHDEERERNKKSGYSEGRRTSSKNYSAELRKAFRDLEVPEGSDFKTCRNAYRRLMMKYHSDKWQSSPNPKKREAAEQASKLINSALEVIEDHYKIK